MLNFLRGNYYATLGAEQDAIPEEINAAYQASMAIAIGRSLTCKRKLLMGFLSRSRIKALIKAHNVLSNPDSRKDYDEVLKIMATLAHVPIGVP